MSELTEEINGINRKLGTLSENVDHLTNVFEFIAQQLEVANYLSIERKMERGEYVADENAILKRHKEVQRFIK